MSQQQPQDSGLPPAFYKALVKQKKSKMKIIIIGATGTIGKKVASSLEKEHEVIKVSNRNGAFKADTGSKSSIEALFKRAGPFDALVAATGRAHPGDMTGLTDEEFKVGIESKLLAQINLVSGSMRWHPGSWKTRLHYSDIFPVIFR